jgi:hypothetical protein
LADNNVTTAKIAFNNVTADQIANNAVTDRQILANAVIDGKIADNAVTTRTILANNVTDVKIADNAVLTRHILANNVTTAKIEFNAVTVDQIANNAVAERQILANAVTNAKIAYNAVDTAQIAFNAVTTEQILDFSVTSSKIDDAVGASTDYYVDGVNGDDTLGVGTIIKPYKTIQKAITEAITPAVIHISSGTYAEQVTLVPDITLDGGDCTKTLIEQTSGLNAVIFTGAGSATIKNIGIGNASGPAGTISVNGATSIVAVINTVIANISGPIAVLANGGSLVVEGDENTLSGQGAAGIISIPAVGHVFIKGQGTLTNDSANPIIVSGNAGNVMYLSEGYTANQELLGGLGSLSYYQTVRTGNILDNNITNAKIAYNAVDNAQIAFNAVHSDQILANAVVDGKIADNAVTTRTILANNVTADQIANNAVTDRQILANAVIDGKIADNAVTTRTILANNVTTAKIAFNAVTTDQLANNAVANRQILANAVTYDKVASIATSTITHIDANIAMGAGAYTVTGLPTPLNNGDAANKKYVDDVAVGLKWLAPCRVLSLKSDVAQAGTPPAAVAGDAWIVNTWGAGYHNGDLVEYSGTAWNVINVSGGGGFLANGTRMIVKHTGAAGSFLGEEDNIAVADGTGAYSFVIPVDGNAVLINGINSIYNNKAYVYESESSAGSPTGWIQFGGAGVYTAGDGIDIASSVISINKATVQYWPRLVRLSYVAAGGETLISSALVGSFTKTWATTYPNLMVWRNGMLQLIGGGNDYTESATTPSFTMISALTAGEVLQWQYTANVA